MACVIEVRDNELYVIVGTKNNKKIKVSKAFKIDLKDPLFSSNSVHFESETVQHIKDELTKHKVTDKKVDLVINSSAIVSKDIPVPKTDKKKLEFIVANEMTALFNLTREFVVDYRILDEIEDEGVPQYQVIASAIRKTTIVGLEALFSRLNMKIRSIVSQTSSFLDFAESMNVVHPYDPTIVIDASTNYIRYYLYNRGDFKLVRSVNVFEGDPDDRISNRVIHVLELLSQAQSRDSGKSVSNVVLLGDKRRFDLINKATQEGLNVPAQIPDFTDMIRSFSPELLDYTNGMGVLL